MKKFLAVVVVLFLGVYLFGCKQEEKALEDPLEKVSMEELSIMQPESMPAPEIENTQAEIVEVADVATGQVLESLPPSGPYKPSAKDIQAALKKAGFYQGEIDGKIGPMSKTAIEEFQKANGLKVDGKVGPQTWAFLEKHLDLKNQ